MKISFLKNGKKEKQAIILEHMQERFYHGALFNLNKFVDWMNYVTPKAVFHDQKQLF